MIQEVSNSLQTSFYSCHVEVTGSEPSGHVEMVYHVSGKSATICSNGIWPLAVIRVGKVHKFVSKIMFS